MKRRDLEKVVEWIHRHHLEIGTIISDRHIQIQKWIREILPQTTHFYDVWHVAKVCILYRMEITLGST